MDAQGEETREKKIKNPKKGVKGNSILSCFPMCDRSTAVFQEYMHGIMGLVKQFLELWLETNSPCNLKGHRDEINRMLGSFKRPDYVTRSPNTTKKISKWKANECRTFLLYLSLIILANFMTPRYLQHWMLFVLAIYLLLQDSVTENDIQKAEVMLNIFLRDFPTLYPVISLTYNFHTLNHYGLTTRRIGPLFSNNAFFWEDFNGSLSERIHGTKNQAIELVKTIQLFQGVQILKARVENKRISEVGCARFLTKIPSFKMTNVQRNLLAESNLELREVFYRAEIFGEVFTCNTYERQSEKNNFTISYTDSSTGSKRYGEIHCFFECTGGEKMAFVDCFVIEHLKMFCHESGVVVKHIIPIRRSEEIHFVPLQNILSKAGADTRGGNRGNVPPPQNRKM